MTLASYEKLREYEKDYRLIPVSKEIYADSITPIILLRKLAVDNSQYYLLESVDNGETWGRYSFLGYNPSAHLTCKDKAVSIKRGNAKELLLMEPMEALRQLLSQYKSPSIKGLPPFTGGIVADSIPDHEYQESENKASAVIDAMMRAGDRRLV